MIKYGTVNPLAAANLRLLSHCPPHFTEVPVHHHDTYVYIRERRKAFSDWIFTNLEGRFCILVTDKKVRIAFENGSEASYFALLLPEICSAEYF